MWDRFLLVVASAPFAFALGFALGSFLTKVM